MGNKLHENWEKIRRTVEDMRSEFCYEFNWKSEALYWLQFEFRCHALRNLLIAQRCEHHHHHHAQRLVPAGLHEWREVHAENSAEQLDHGGMQILWNRPNMVT